MGLPEKKDYLYEYLETLGSLAVAFSSGADSTFLLKCAHECLGDNCFAVTVRSDWFPRREFIESREFCDAEGIRHFVVESKKEDIDGFRQNPPDRCYLCKRELFGRILELAHEEGIAFVAEGSNADDPVDYRPGLRAIKELGILSPLRQAGLSKSDIRELSRELGLLTWNKPSCACLASRFVYGEEISDEKLAMVERAEEWLRLRGFVSPRVRIHGKLARIEIMPGEFPDLLACAAEAESYMRSLGFDYVAMDLAGFKSGSMNRTLPEDIIYGQNSLS